MLALTMSYIHLVAIVGKTPFLISLVASSLVSKCLEMATDKALHCVLSTEDLYQQHAQEVSH